MEPRSQLGLGGRVVAGVLMGFCLGVLGTWLMLDTEGSTLEVVPVVASEMADPVSERPQADGTPADGTTVDRARNRAPLEKPIGRYQLEDGPPDARLGVIVYGTVCDEQGRPIDGARIEFVADSSDAEPLTTSTVRGGYTIHGLRPGAFRASIRKQGFRDSDGEVVIPAHQTHRLDFELTSAYLVRVLVSTPEGEPIRVAMRKARTWPIDLNAVGTAQPPEGHLTLAPNAHLSYGIGKWFGNPDREDMLLGELELHGAPPAYVSVVLRDRVLATERLDPGQGEVGFQISLDEVLEATATVRARIVDAETRLPIGTSRMFILGGAPGATASSEGVVVLTAQLTGMHVLRVSAKDYASRYEQLRLPPGETDLGTIALTRSVEVRFVVIDSRGEPQSASVSGYSPAAVKSPQSTPRHWTASKDFDEYVAKVLPGRNIVRASVPGKAATVAAFHTDSAQNGPIRLVLSPVEVVAIDNTSMPRNDVYTISIYDKDGRLVFGQHMQTSDVFRTELPEGQYRFEVHHAAVQIQRGTVDVHTGGEPRIVVR